MFNNSLNLHGRFKFSVFDRNNALKYSTDYIPNFITNTGMSYPLSFAFADCFRYISIGSGTGANTIIGNGTTGLQSGFNLSGYSYVGGGGGCVNQAGHVPNKYVTEGCGYRINNTGVTLSRAWRIPDSEDTFFTFNTTVREYMLTPGQPYVTGWISDNGTLVPGSGCGCDIQVYPENNGFSIPNYGKENALIASYYDSNVPICEATKAFTRILKDITVLTNEYLVINYSLDINYNTGIRSFNLLIGNGGLAELPNHPEQEYNYNWRGYLSGIYSIVHPGLKLINDASFRGISDIDNVWGVGGTVGSGESFVPPLGDTLEPHLDTNKRVAYISSDNLQFIVNDLSGGAMPTGSYFPYNINGRAFPSGLMGFHKNWISETTTDLTQFLGGKILSDPMPHFLSPRTDNNVGKSYYPLQTSYKDASESPTTLRHLAAQSPSSRSENAYTSSDRNRSITLSYQWKDPTIANDYFPVRAFMLGYNYSTNPDYWYPFLDTLFAPKTGTIEPAIATGTGFLSYADPALAISSTNKSGYYFMDDLNILTLQYKIAWSSSCPNTVIGC